MEGKEREKERAIVRYKIIDYHKEVAITKIDRENDLRFLEERKTIIVSRRCNRR